jgi:predicted flap endonuclease-1-like 5' DNA nuclease
VQAMCLNGALILAQGARPAELRTALLCGLLHDLGEMYIGPAYGEAEADRTLDVVSYQQLVVHPHVGRLLITQLTDYPAVIARAIGEHHERLDGSGYPHCLQGDQVSAHGRLLAVTETTLAALADGTAPLSRASIALRVIPGEYDLHWMGLISSIASAQPSAVAVQLAEALRLRLTALDTAMRAAQAASQSLMTEAATPALKEALALTDHLLTRLHGGLVTSGLWSFTDVAPQDATEVEAIEGELRFRLRRIERAVRLRAGTLTDEDTARLDRMCRLLDIGR